MNCLVHRLKEHNIPVIPTSNLLYMVHDSLLAAKKISYRTYQKKFNKFTNFSLILILYLHLTTIPTL
jgi:hypothetical protein